MPQLFHAPQRIKAVRHKHLVSDIILRLIKKDEACEAYEVKSTIINHRLQEVLRQIPSLSFHNPLHRER
jgi:hypothetical protein